MVSVTHEMRDMGQRVEDRLQMALDLQRRDLSQHLVACYCAGGLKRTWNDAKGSSDRNGRRCPEIYFYLVSSSSS